ncbi:hypothetical protein SAMN05660479_02853 [Microbulbifer thermotolerans]|uniref:hypothetical protein n=1 Tax=Microbulbifer thermotolerans TaxID=252514 RepID=UPI0008E22F33|nr:hypothetical protein [Microbulbifer thermotolerans]SFC97366.1 hypothetical protein SAMN05660479_02853 [Microbulbifer thermotolerans]
MSSKFTYQSDDYGRQSQRFVIPLYIKDELENYEYSSTATLVRYKGHHFIIFAAHALDSGVEFENVYTFGSDGDFHQIMSFAIGHQAFEEEDIVIVDCFNKVLENKNYFNLDINSMNGFDKKRFAWIGFPASKSKLKKVHKSSSKESLKNKFVYIDEGGSYFKNAKYFTIISKIVTNNKIQISGIYNRKGVNLRYQGDVSMGPHPQGMSGGAMYFFSNNRTLKDSLDDSFRFAGIGIEYKKDNSIIGVSRPKIIELIERFDSEKPMQFKLVSNSQSEVEASET